MDFPRRANNSQNDIGFISGLRCWPGESMSRWYGREREGALTVRSKDIDPAEAAGTARREGRRIVHAGFNVADTLGSESNLQR